MQIIDYVHMGKKSNDKGSNKKSNDKGSTKKSNKTITFSKFSHLDNLSYV